MQTEAQAIQEMKRTRWRRALREAREDKQASQYRPRIRIDSDEQPEPALQYTFEAEADAYGIPLYGPL